MGAVAILVAGTLAAAPAARGDPAVVVQKFYLACLSLHVRGLPSKAEMKKLSPLLSSDLLRLIRDARTYQKKLATEHPDDKPPFADGDLFSSLFEGPTRFTVGAVEPRGDGFRVVVRFERDDPRDPNAPFKWEDAAILKAESGRLVLDDIELLGGWDFATRGRLSEILKTRY
jgi:hypothetical protein